MSKQQLLSFFIFVSIAIGYAQEEDSKKDIVRLPMNSDATHVIPLHPEKTCTVMFPYDIEGLSGDGFVTGQVVSGDYKLDFNHEGGGRFFSLLPLKSNAPDRNLNVIVGGDVYVFRVTTVDEPKDSWSAVTFMSPEKFEKMQNRQISENVKNLKEEKNEGEGKELKVSEDPPEKEFEEATTNRVLTFMDMAKVLAPLSVDTLSKAHKEMPYLDISMRENDLNDYGSYQIHIRQVIRDNRIDALAFTVIVENKSNNKIELNPESFFVRAGANVYDAVTADAASVIEKGESVVANFVIVGGSQQGGKNYLKVDNQFKVGVQITNSPPKNK